MRLSRLILDLKAETGILHKAMVDHGISVESAPTSNKQKEQSTVVKQNVKFAGIAKKKSRSRRTNRKWLVEPLYELTDSDNKTQHWAAGPSGRHAVQVFLPSIRRPRPCSMFRSDRLPERLVDSEQRSDRIDDYPI